MANERPFQFEWDEVRADANVRKHGVTFELAGSGGFPSKSGSHQPARRRNHRSIDDNDTLAEIDFRKGVRGLHHIPPGAKVLMPVSIERGVWEYFSGKAEQRGIELSELLTEVLKRDVEMNEALK